MERLTLTLTRQVCDQSTMTLSPRWRIELA